ncbi:ribosome maturation factor RimP [Arachnia propionica]|uniref:Ribosome maturation factor RimP n=1 Tax=Arachnia propionica TaxID=1750 RepID=A0A3P1T235_9ACTN|nr:ribosome maturation factor RimP [Arachnia propionica]MDO5084065.1 ribosome maturation factor RimP [Arachnia propionica]RRD03419.1 ribosome maturation factor RimP [Arachnia propionica]
MQDKELVALVEPILASAGLELDSLEVTPIGKRRLLRITVDGDGPIGRGPLLDDISAASAQISAALDATDAVGAAPYTLEVSSRGVGKPLTEPKHYRRNHGRLVKLTLADEGITGRIVGASDDAVRLRVDGAEREIPLDDIRRAVVQVEMNPPKEFALPGDDNEEEEV